MRPLMERIWSPRDVPELRLVSGTVHPKPSPFGAPAFTPFVAIPDRTPIMEHRISNHVLRPQYGIVITGTRQPPPLEKSRNRPKVRKYLMLICLSVACAHPRTNGRCSVSVRPEPVEPGFEIVTYYSDPCGGPSGIPVSIHVIMSSTSVRARKGPRRGILP